MIQNNPVGSIDILGLSPCSIDLSAEWTHRPKLHDVKVGNIKGSVGINVSTPILFLAITPPSDFFDKPDIKFSGNVSVSGVIKGRVNCKANCKCQFGRLTLEGERTWTANPEINLVANLSFQYERKWMDFISDINSGSGYLREAVIAMTPCKFVPHPVAKALCWANKALSANRFKNQVAYWTSEYYDLSDNVAEKACLGAVVGINTYEVNITQHVNWLTNDNNSFTKISIDASNMK